MTIRTIFTFSLLVSTAFAAPARAQGDIVATRCNACSDMQFEQMAIGAGNGKRWLYDFAGGELRAYQVGREPNGSGGFFYEAISLPVEAVYRTLFDRALAVYRSHGSLSKSAVVTLVGAPGVGSQADASVFTLFNSPGGMTTFGLWLAQYLGQNIDVAPPASEIQALSVANPKIEFTGDKTRLKVTVIFKDGRAEFELNHDEKKYNYLPGTAFDERNARIPESASQIGTHNNPFPGGEQSSAYQGFLSLMQYWRISIGAGGWICETVTGGGSVQRNCHLDR